MLPFWARRDNESSCRRCWSSKAHTGRVFCEHIINVCLINENVSAGSEICFQDEGRAIARTKVLHVGLIVLASCVSVYFMGAAWTDSLESLAGGIYREPHFQLFGSMFGFVAVAFLVGGLYECAEPGLIHRHTIAGKEIAHSHRAVEVLSRMLCMTLVRAVSFVLMAALSGPA